MEKNLFEIATREKYRFPFRGSISVEELWDLTLKNLDSVFKVLKAELKNTEDESLLEVSNKDTIVLNNKIDIIKYIVEVKKDEAKKKEDSKFIAEQKNLIKEIIAKKKNDELGNLSIEELTAKLNSLEG